MLPFSSSELKIISPLTTPIKIQNFLDTLAINFEKNGDTLMSPRAVLRERKAHCMEGALLAASILWFQGERPLILDLKADKTDDDHVVALYKIGGYWGALSKSNHASLRFRDPVYKTVRELALSYFHEYFHNKSGTKTLISYSRPFDLRRFKHEWLTTEANLWHISAALDASPHSKIITKKNKRFIRKADRMERRAGEIVEWKKDGSSR